MVVYINTFLAIQDTLMSVFAIHYDQTLIWQNMKFMNYYYLDS